jgi:hypothetical protein
MLLHVIEAAEPIHLAGGRPLWQGVGQQMSDARAFLHDVDHLDTPQASVVERLATGRGIERRAIQINPAAIVCSLYNGGVKIGKVRVGIIEPIGHGNPMPQRGVRP